MGVISASPLQYNTSGSAFTGSGFVTNTGTMATFGSGSSIATLTYVGPGPGPSNIPVNTPTNISYGSITLSCAGCTSLLLNSPAFGFNLVVNNITDSTSNTFVGFSAAGSISSNSSTIAVAWTPTTLQDGSAIFTITSPTLLPALTSGTGTATVQGSVTSALQGPVPNSVPEPASVFLLGAALIGVGYSARNRFTGQG